MERSTEITQDARGVLLRCLEAGVTGALEGEVPLVGPIAVYVMMGEIVAARGEDDDGALLRLLVNQGVLHAGEVRALRDQVDAGASLAALLSDTLPEDRVAVLLFERFRENLYQFLRMPGEPSFVEMEAVFVENIQVGHDSRALLDELVALRQRVAATEDEPTRAYAPGVATVSLEEEVQLLELCGGRRPLREMLARAPWEPNRTLDRLVTMLGRGLITAEAPRRPQRKPVPLRAEAPTQARGVREPPANRRSSQSPAAPDEFTEEATRPGVQPPVEAPPPAPAPPPPTPPPGGWEDDLAAFGDYDYARGDGSYSGSQLDRVEIGAKESPAVGPASTETEIEMAEADASVTPSNAVRISFAPPRLQDDEAIQRIDVVSEVLSTVVAALDEAHGPGTGHARVQVLLEGTAGLYAPVFKGVELRPGGWLPAERVLKNVRDRPAGEHRNLLNGALEDVIQRALSLASAELEDAPLDRMLEKIAGFQARFSV